jgi:hypothetical protein
VSHIRNLKRIEQFTEWFEEVFILNYLPGRIFLLAPSKHIYSLCKKIGMHSQPVLIPHMEWDAGGCPSLFLPWTVNPIPSGAWIRISKHSQPYFGDLAFVMGSAAKSDVMLITVVPRICQTPSPEDMLDKMYKMDKEAGEIRKQRGKG